MFVLGASSLSKLEGVHPRLVECVKLAITITPQDFTVTDGVRTVEQQRALVARGASKTLFSRHLPQSDGFGHAVDLVPWVGGPRWEWPLIYPIASAMGLAAKRLGLNLIWGGAWDVRLPSGSQEAMARLVADYSRRHPGPDFLDGPHYELA